MNRMKRVEERRNSQLICLRDLSSLRNSRQSTSVDGEEDGKMKRTVLHPALQSHQPTSSPASAPAAATIRLLSPADVATKGSGCNRRHLFVGCNEPVKRHSPSESTSDIAGHRLLLLRTPPPSVDSSPAQHLHHRQQQQQQLGKLKRFLATLEKLGTDISPVIGHEVKSLVHALVENVITVEEFHDQLHRTTNLPLRPFVIPFLKSNLPILREEVQSRLKEMPRLSPCPSRDQQQTQIQNPPSIESNVSQSYVADCQSSTPPNDMEGNRKRSVRDFNYNKTPENGEKMTGGSLTPPTKRLRTCSSSSSSRPFNPCNVHSLDDASNAHSTVGASDVQIDSLPYPSANALSSIPSLEGDTNAIRLIAQCLDKSEERTNPNRFYSGCSHRVSVDRFDKEWNYVETILQCIVSLAERCQRALHVLQRRSVQRSKNDLTSKKNNWSVPIKSSSSFSCCSSSSSSSSFCCNRLTVRSGTVTKKQIPADSSQETEIQQDEQGLDIKRSSEDDTVNDDKRLAMLELQKAVTAAEAKASKALSSSDRRDMVRTIAEVRERTRIEVEELLNRQVDCNESCWNCGRLASETCSGCNRARYCGIFCQHRHWEIHHRVCGKTSHRFLCKSSPTRPDPGVYLCSEVGTSSPNHSHSETTLAEDYRGNWVDDTMTVQRPSDIRAHLKGTKALGQFETQLVVSVKQETI